MKGRLLTAAEIAEFTEHLVLEERSAATVEKYVRDVRAFAAYAPDGKITKETVIAYKKHLQEIYAVRSVNSMLASINCLFTFLGWHDLKVVPASESVSCNLSPLRQHGAARRW